MAINVQHIKDVETASSVSNDSKLLLTPDNGQYTRATISNIVGSTVDSNEFIVNSTTKKIELKDKTFVGTTAEWGALTSVEKAKYKYVAITDDSSGSGGGGGGALFIDNNGYISIDYTNIPTE